MTGFDSVIHRSRSLLFGMATVPVTHMLHPIFADNLVSKANRIAEAALARLGALSPVAVAA